MIGLYPGTGQGMLRRQRGREGRENNTEDRIQEQDQVLDQDHIFPRTERVMRTSHLYCLVSTIVAILAIVTSSGNLHHNMKGPSSTQESFNIHKFQKSRVKLDSNANDEFSIENMAKAAATAISQDNEIIGNQINIKQFPPNPGLLNNVIPYTFFFRDENKKQKKPQKNDAESGANNVKSSSLSQNNKPFQLPIGLRWIERILPFHTKSSSTSFKDNNKTRPKTGHLPSIPFLSFFLSMVDDAIIYPNEHGGATQVIDKILTSTPRLLAIANLLLAVTYLLHSVVADLFLGTTANVGRNGNAQNNINDPTRNMSTDERHRQAGRERLGGFLIFKLLLISAVVEPDTLDLLILLSWYTLLSFLRSLSHIAACTTNHTSQAGLPPRRGVLRLLLLVLCCNFTAAACCVALFHGAGIGMVLLLTCDCALLALDVFVHLARHASQVLETKHANSLLQIEEQQIQLHTQNRESTDMTVQERNNDEMRFLDRQVELLESNHTNRLQVFDRFIFYVELMTAGVTTCHFLHIWSLHGLTCGLVDGVLALHLHTAISAATRKIAERRSMYKISRDLDGFFEDASDSDIQKASMNGDVCCICLCTMTVGNVKKVGCGHLYHMHCLREVVERAKSIEAARCPLCRASVVNGSHSQANNNNAFADNIRPPNNNQNNNNNNINNNIEQIDVGTNNIINNPNAPPDLDLNPQQLPPPNEHALFRFSTEGIIPPWLPLPAFSFEVVRRPPIATDVDNNNNNTNNDNGQQGQQNQNENDNQRGQSFWHRLLVFAGAVPMSPEEEAAAITQLVDMFPQYDRSALLQELRDRLSTEAVVESILMGTFRGVARGAGTNFVVPPNENVPLIQNTVRQNIPTNDHQETSDNTDQEISNNTLTTD